MWHKIVTGEVRISDLARAMGSLAFMCRCIPVYFFGLNQLLSIHPAAAPCRLESENMAVAFEGRAPYHTAFEGRHLKVERHITPEGIWRRT